MHGVKGALVSCNLKCQDVTLFDMFVVNHSPQSTTIIPSISYRDADIQLVLIRILIYEYMYVHLDIYIYTACIPKYAIPPHDRVCRMVSIVSAYILRLSFIT